MNTTKKYVLITVLSILSITIYCKGKNPKGKTPDPNIAEDIINFVNRFQIEHIETVYLRWNSSPYAGFPSEEDNRGYPIRLTWDCPGGYLYDLRDAIKVFPFKEMEGAGRIHFTIRFYDESLKELFRISLARPYPSIIINGKAYEPTPEIMKSLKYLMPHLAYDEISNSSDYKIYFIEEPKEEQNEKEEGDTPKKTQEEINK
jgi:hypothetical protein